VDQAVALVLDGVPYLLAGAVQSRWNGLTCRPSAEDVATLTDLVWRAGYPDLYRAAYLSSSELFDAAVHKIGVTYPEARAALTTMARVSPADAKHDAATRAAQVPAPGDDVMAAARLAARVVDGADAPWRRRLTRSGITVEWSLPATRPSTSASTSTWFGVAMTA
jgi:hypothetical protein